MEFEIAVEDAVLDDLRARLRRTRWPAPAPGEPWAQGTDRAFLEEFVEYWADGFDWRAAERRLNAFPQFVEGGIHFVHVRGGGIPLILTHGWPSAWIEFLPLVERLKPHFDLVIPSLPGFGFSSRPSTLTTRDTARLWHALMRGLGYERYAAHGGDWGAAVTAYMALDDPGPLIGIHFANLDTWPANASPVTEAEREYVDAVARWDAAERGYSFQQGTRPQTLAYGLADSPAALAAWVLEKWRAWGDTGGDLGRFDRDFLCALLTLYWLGGPALRDYYDNRAAGTATLHGYVNVPTGIANFHNNFVSEGVLPPEWAERSFNVQRFTDMPRGGHFAAAEEPDLLAEDLIAFLS